MPQTSALPKYIQISEMLIREVAAGHLPDGVKLPPEREMAADLGIAVGTLRKSLADMQEKGLFQRIHGSGNYVRAKSEIGSVYAFFRLEKVSGGGLPTARVLSVDRLPKPDGAPDFGASPFGHRIRRLRWLDDELIALEEIWLDGSFRESITAEDLSESLYLFYREELGLSISAVEDSIGCAQVPAWSPREFHLAVGTHTGFIERVSRLNGGAPVEYSRTWFDANRSRYISRMGRG